MMSPAYCFVFGCPRSGTSALTRLLHAHDEVAIGMERYKRLLKTPEGRANFTPSLFQPERFRDFRGGGDELDRCDAQFNQQLERYT